MSCTYTYQGKTYTAWEFADLLESMPVEELMKYLPAEAAYKLVQASEGNVKNWYFSQLFRAVNTASDKVFGQAANVKNWIEANAGKMGVKKDELQWTGVLDWLDMKGKERVSKADVLDYLRGNGVQVQEVMKGEDEIAKIQAKIDAINEEFNALVDRFGPIPDMPTDAKAEIDRLTAEHDELADQMSAMHPSDFATKYGSYTIPGGDNYRELLLTLPVRLPDGFSIERSGAMGSVIDANGRVVANAFNNPSNDELINVAKRNIEQKTGYRSSHWDEANILAHIRFNDRVDADGTKVLFIEEIQSDWGQQGKKRGFAQSYMTNEQRQQKKNEARAIQRRIKARADADRAAGMEQISDETLRLNKADNDLIHGIMVELDQDEQRKLSALSGAVPSAPFVTDTKAWVSLAMKRMIAYAVENGYDKVAFVNGEQSAERYDLSKSISKVTWMPEGNGGLLMADDINGNSVLNNRLKDASEIEDYVGKDVAKRLLETKPRYDAYTAEQIHELSGLDLKVGGEGMKTFYNQIVPQVANDLLKKLGGKIESVSIDVAEEDLVVPKEEQTPEWSDQLGFSITPEMREKASGGLPLFSKRELPDTIEVDGKSRPTRNSNGKPIHPTEEGIRNFWRWFGDSRVVDEQGRPLVVYHGSKTPKYLTEFIPGGKDGSRLTGDAYGVGAYFTTSPNEASTPVYTGEEGAVFPVYVRGNLLNLGGELTAEQSAALTKLANDVMLPSDKARFSLGRKTREFDDVQDARDFFDNQRANWQQFGDGMDRAKPDARADGGKYQVEYTDFDAQIEIKTGEEAGTLLRAIGFDNAMAAGFDGIVMDRAGGSKWAVMYRPDGNVKSATGNNGDFDGSNPNIQASIDFSIKDKIDSAVEKASKLRDRLERSDSLIQNKIAHAFDTVIGAATGDTAKTFNWYHKGPGSQYHKAKIDPHYAKVYNAAQSYIEDIARYGTEAADLAPGLLPKMDTVAGAWREVRNSVRDSKDQEAIAAPIYAGTLEYARDDNDRLYKTDDVNEAGVVFSDQELEKIFGLNERQRDLYRQFRKAVDHSLEVMAIAEMNKTAKVNDLELADEEMSMNNLANFYSWQFQDKLNDLRKRYDELAVVHEANLQQLKINADRLGVSREKYAQSKAKMEADQTAEHLSIFREIERLEKLEEAFNGKQVTINKLKQKGYAPLMRFGKYTVDVVKKVPALDEDGNQIIDRETGEQKMADARVFFGMFESENEARKAERILSEEYPDHVVSRGVASEDGFQLFGGVNPGSLEAMVKLLGNAVGTEDQIVQQFYKDAVASRSALKRLIHRQGIAGYSKDVVRSLASFLMSNARATSSADHFGDIIEAALDIPKNKGDVQKEAVKLINYLRDPNEEAGTLRGLLFMQFLGGSLASAAVNLTQTITTTFPYLNQYGIKVTDLTSAGTLAAKRMAGKASNIDPELSNALAKAEEEGVVAPHNIHVLMGQTGVKNSPLPSWLGGGNMVVDRAWQGLSHMWGSFFGMAEQFNRETAFIAAYQLAKKMGDSGLRQAYDKQAELNASRGLPPPDRKPFSNAFEFAKNAVNETQFVLSKAARSNWGRGAVGATLLTFKTFSIMYMELFKRLPNKERAVMLGTIILLAGIGGLPFDDDLDDLIDTMGQMLGYSTNMNKWKDQVLVDLVGKQVSDFVMHGVSAFLPLDLSNRLGMSNLIPATGLLKKSNSGNHELDYAELLGAAGGYMKQLMDAWDYTQQGRYGMALSQGLLPKGIKDIVKGIDMAATGVYDDTRGRRVTDVDGWDSFFKFIGFQPTKVSEIQRIKGNDQQDINLVKAVKAGISEMWAQANYDRDNSLRTRAMSMLAEWNEKNPTMKINIDKGAIQRRVKQMGMTAQDRFVKTAPKEMRESVRKSFE